MGSSKKVTVGFRYKMGLHFVLCRTLDRLDEIIVGERSAWLGPQAANGTININKWDLFGGDKREGGVQGAADVLFGAAAQTQNAYLVSQLGDLIPAFRGVVSLVFKGGRVTGNNPYLKPWWFRGERILTTHDGSTQWYAAKAPVPIPDSGVLPATMVASGSFDVNAVTNAGTTASAMKLVAGGDIQGVLATDEVRLWPKYQGTYLGLSVWGEPELGGPLTGSAYTCWYVENDETSASTFGPGGGPFDGYQAAFDAAAIAAGAGGFTLTGATRYRFGVVDTPIDDNSGGTSWYYEVWRGAGSYRAMNPAHIVRECLTDPYMRMNYPTAMIDDASFTAAADTFYAEGMGLNFFWANQGPVKEFLQMVLDHCGAVCYADPVTGKFVLRAIRGDYDVGTLDSFDESSILSLESFERSGTGEVVNEISVSYFDVMTAKDAIVTVQDLASVNAQGSILAETRQYPGIGWAALAARVAQRDLTASTSSLARLKVRFTREAVTLTPGDVVKISWAKLGLVNLVCRVLDVNYGTLMDGTVVADMTQDVFGLPSASYQADQPSGWEYQTDQPLPVADQHVLEGTYWDVFREASPADFAALSDTSGFVYTLAEQANSSQYSYSIYSRIAPADFELAQEGMSFAPKAQLSVAVERDDVTITIDEAGAGEVTDNIAVGDRLLLPGDRLEEQMEVTDLSNLATGVIGVNRGILDTTPQEFASGTDVWLLEYDEEDFGRDAVERFDGDTVDYKLLSASGAGDSPIELAPQMSLTFDSRMFRPYPPGDVEIDGEAFPSDDVLPGFTVTWAHRDRTQQTASFIAQEEGDIGPEAGTTYNLYFYDDVSNAVLHSTTGLTGTTYTMPTVGGIFPAARLELESLRDGVVSWERQVRVFSYLGSVPLRGAMLARSTTTAPTINATTPITWDTETRDDGGLWASGTPTVITLPDDGWWLASFTHVCDLGAAAWGVNSYISQTGAASAQTSKAGYDRPVLTTFDQGRCVFALDRYTAGATLIANLVRANNGSGTPTVEANAAFGVARCYSAPVVGASVRRTSSFAMAAASDVAVTFNAEDLDDGGMYDAAQPTKLTVPAGGAGWYVMAGGPRWASASGASHRTIYIRKNGTASPQWAHNQFPTGAITQTTGQTALAIEYLADGDALSLVLRTGESGGSTVLSAVLSACRVGYGIADGATVSRSTNQTIAVGDNVLNFDTEVRDDGGLADLATFNTRLTAVKAGYYAVCAVAANTTTGTTANRYVYLRKNGTTELCRQGTDTPTAAGGAFSPGCVTYLAAGDFVEAVMNANSATAVSGVRLSMCLLSPLP